MKRFNTVFTFLLIGIIAINISPLVFAQDVVEISADKAVITSADISNGTIVAIPVTDSSDFPVKRIEISAKQPIELAEFTIEVMDSSPEGVAEVNGTVYQHLSLETTLTVEDVSYIKIDFGVPKSWITTNDIDETIVRLVSTSSEGDWDIILTEKTGETNDEIIFTAPLINLDTNNYAIAEIPPWVATTTLTQIQTKTTTITTDTATVTSTVAGNTLTVTNTVGAGGTSTLAYLAIGAAVVAVGILLFVNRSKKRKQ